MSFNNGNERRKLNAKWEHLRVQYREAGMSEDAIQAIPYICIFVLHRRFYERERPYHLRASDLRGNGTDPGNDPVHPHALRCLPL